MPALQAEDPKFKPIAADIADLHSGIPVLRTAAIKNWSFVNTAVAR